MDEPQTHDPEMCYMLAIHWDTIGSDTGGIRPCMARFFRKLPAISQPSLPVSIVINIKRRKHQYVSCFQRQMSGSF